MSTAAHTPARLPALIALSGAAALTLGGLTAVPAYAHDSLIGSTPEEGEVLEEPPGEIILEFSGAGLTVGDTVTNDIWVLDEDDENWASEEPAEVDGSTMSTELPEGLPDGDYEVVYRVVYSDGHDEEAGFTFEVDAEEDAAGEDEPAADDEAEEPGAGGAAEEADPALEDETDGAEQTGDEDGLAASVVLIIGAVVLIVLVGAGLVIRQKLKAGDRTSTK
ncbi:copper resistance CopC family protein [Nesterenkonia populi]|uniref:copper resistance CopC family protein n=1 Tax=Nesterenkonia populi TaxID=1591087 RepID=UPI0011BDCED3|nr:copper resistance CopC family protein [Nesterenkonia populi]